MAFNPFGALVDGRTRLRRRKVSLLARLGLTRRAPATEWPVHRRRAHERELDLSAAARSRAQRDTSGPYASGARSLQRTLEHQRQRPLLPRKHRTVKRPGKRRIELRDRRHARPACRVDLRKVVEPGRSADQRGRNRRRLMLLVNDSFRDSPAPRSKSQSLRRTLLSPCRASTSRADDVIIVALHPLRRLARRDAGEVHGRRRVRGVRPGRDQGGARRWPGIRTTRAHVAAPGFTHIE